MLPKNSHFRVSTHFNARTNPQLQVDLASDYFVLCDIKTINLTDEIINFSDRVMVGLGNRFCLRSSSYRGDYGLSPVLLRFHILARL